MSLPKEPEPAKLIISLFMKEKSLINSVSKPLAEKFGDIDMVSSWFPFNFTTYYETEMGVPLFRRVLCFKNLIKQSDLSDIKIATNNLESAYSENGKRMVNIDPGYMIYSRFVLASGKNFAHRIYIGKKIYADITLIYADNAFQKLPWTYPDYAEKNMLTFLEMVRNRYAVDLKSPKTYEQALIPKICLS